MRGERIDRALNQLGVNVESPARRQISERSCRICGGRAACPRGFHDESYRACHRKRQCHAHTAGRMFIAGHEDIGASGKFKREAERRALGGVEIERRQPR